MIARFAQALIRLGRDRDPESALRLGARIGRRWVQWGGPRVAEARLNLELALPELARGEREAILRRSFENTGRSLAEVVLLHGQHRDELVARVRVEGIEHLEAARRSTPHGGAFILTGHFGSWELGGAVLASRGYPVTSVHRARGDRGLEELATRWREASGQEVVALGEAGLGALRAVRRGRLVLMLVDQNARRREGVFAPFFGVPASTRFGPARLATRLGVPVVPAFLHRVGESGDHIGRIYPAVELEREPDASGAADVVLRENVARMNRVLEDVIRAEPEQWMWAHRRFRTRPPGEPPIYPARPGSWRWLRRSLRGRRASLGSR